MKPTIPDKKTFYQLSRMGLLGNTLVQWSYEEFTQRFYFGESLPELVSLRTTRVASTPGQLYRITPKAMIAYCKRLIRRGFKIEELLIDESAPDYLVELQAEVMNTPNFIYLRYAIRSGLGMRQALEHASHVEGIRAITILRHFLDEDSVEEVFQLLSCFSSSTIELSSYSVPVGVLKTRTLIWEVRTY